MGAIIDAAFARATTVVLVFVLLIVLGTLAYLRIPKEAAPDVAIPIVYVHTALEGISPEDAERLLVEPLETELSALEGLKELRAEATEGFAAITLEFDAGFDPDVALDDVRVAVDRARPELPEDATEPVVQEVNVALFPILTAILSGPVPERTLVALANDVKDALEALPGVLEVDVGGDREELLEVLVDPVTLETYGISFEALTAQVARNNRLIAAGALETVAGRIVLKVPGLIEDVPDVLEMPVKVTGDTVVTFADVAVVRRAFKEPEGFARIDGEPALSLEVKKRTGANIIETVAAVRGTIADMRSDWPESVRVRYMQDQSDQVKTLLGELENNVLAAVILVLVVIVASLGLRNGILVGLAIPGSFLTGIAILWAMGYTLNIVALFSLILVVGMLVDGAIVTVELAERNLSTGMGPREAYAAAAKRMAWPVISGTATTLAVFVPLLFWTGVVGEFMKYMPITVIVTLGVSLAMALVFIPVLGSVLGGGGGGDRRTVPATSAPPADGTVSEPPDAFTRGYMAVLRATARRPALTLAVALWVLVGAFQAYGAFGRGVEFFPDIEPEFVQVQVTARDNLSIGERDALVRRVEDRLMDMPAVEAIYARTIGEGGLRQLGEDVIGVVQLDLVEWDRRAPAARIIEEVRARLADLAGIDVKVEEQRQGPTAEKPVNLEVHGPPGRLEDGVAAVREVMDELGGFTDVTDTRAIPGVEWRLVVDRSAAARYRADVVLLGQAVQLLTTGVEVGEYRPDYADEAVDIRVRFPPSERTLERLENLRVPTAAGLVPIRNFVTFEATGKTGTITRIDGERVLEIAADVEAGLLSSERVAALSAALEGASLPAGVSVSFVGEAEEQREAQAFLLAAFAAAVSLMFIVLVTQFNSIWHALVVMSAIVFSIAGVLLGLLVTGRPFGIVMGGIGIIALAGVVVNDNIVLIDTYADLRRRGLEALEAVVETGRQRLRPVLLTSVTTILGLMPMVLGATVDIVGRDIAFGAPSTQWWTELSSAIAGGLALATVLTLILTPSMLMLGHGLGRWWGDRRIRGDGAHPAPTG